MTDKSLLSFEYKVSSFLSNAYGKLGLYHLLNLLQDVASQHGDLLGFGYEDMVRMQTFWVLTRQKVVMRKWPVLGDSVEIKTWIRFGEGALAYRDFSIHLNGEQIGESCTGWITLNSETRRPTIIDRSSLRLLVEELPSVGIETEKIPRYKKDDLEDMIRFNVRNSDIDFNMHVNNTKYAQWVLDSIPLASQGQFDLLSYEINFIAETMLHDIIVIQKSPRDYQEDGSFKSYFQGKRQSDGKIVFISRLGVSA